MITFFFILFQGLVQIAGFQVSTDPAIGSRPTPWDGTQPNQPVRHWDQGLQSCIHKKNYNSLSQRGQKIHGLVCTGIPRRSHYGCGLTGHTLFTLTGITENPATVKERKIAQKSFYVLLKENGTIETVTILSVSFVKSVVSQRTF